MRLVPSGNGETERFVGADLGSSTGPSGAVSVIAPTYRTLLGDLIDAVDETRPAVDRIGQAA